MRPRRSEEPTEKVTIYLTPPGLTDLKAAAADAGMSIGAFIEHLRRPGAVVKAPKVAKTRPVSPTPAQVDEPMHVCRQFRWSEARHANVCVEEFCQKPKHR